MKIPSLKNMAVGQGGRNMTSREFLLKAKVKGMTCYKYTKSD